MTDQTLRGARSFEALHRLTTCISMEYKRVLIAYCVMETPSGDVVSQVIARVYSASGSYSTRM